MFSEEKRRLLRVRFRAAVQRTIILADGSKGMTATVPARDISKVGLGFYSEEEIKLNAKLAISFSLFGKEKVFFLGEVMRVELAEEGPAKYLIGVKIEKIDEAHKARINDFVDQINIFSLLDKLKLKGAVDIHLIGGYPPIIKKPGTLEVSSVKPLSPGVLGCMLLNLLDEQRYRKFIKEKEINFVFSYKEGWRFRVNLHLQRGNIEGVFRLIPYKIHLPHQLGLPKTIEGLLENKKGLIVIAGRTGSGKTTTLASMVEYLNEKRQGVVISIEDPIEYIHTNKGCFIKQREVGRDTVSFSSAAKNALRQNPDVLVIGEVLDRESMEVAITAAETGMLVFTSIHAAESSQALDRLASFFPPELHRHILTRLSLTLKGIITQELVIRSDEQGVVVAAEVLVANDALRRVIRDGDWKQIATVIQTGKSIGMQSMRDSLEEHYRRGLIGVEYIKEYI